MRDAAGTTGKQHRVLFHKTLHQVLGPGKIIDQLWRMIKDVKQEYPPSGRSLADHIYILAKGLVIIRFINRCISIAFYIIIKRYPLVTNQLFEIVPVPFVIS